jgi:hypothetical protein
VDYCCLSVSEGDWFQETPRIPASVCPSPLSKTAYKLDPPMYLKSSLSYLQCLMQYKCWVNNCYAVLLRQ